MSHLVVLPILLPLAAAALLLVLTQQGIVAQRCVAVTTTLACCAASLLLTFAAMEGDPSAYRVGDWPAPFGIMLVVDRLSATLLLLTDVVALASLFYAFQGVDRQGRHFHALFQFQLVGIHGAFLTGDLFNLFVFFEILLIASYCLLLHGGGEERLRAALHYVVLNLIGSTIFLVAIGAIYGVTGALNMAHIAMRIRELAPQDAAIVRAAGLLAFIVFALKAAIVPIHFWLPRAYPAATAPVAAFFAIMTKVGIYCIIRVSTLMFGADAGVGSELFAAWLVPVALLTQLLAVLGALASRDLRRLSSYLLINSVGVMLVGVGLFSQTGLTSALYYLVHSTLTIAAMFLLADHVTRSRGEVGDRLEQGPPFARSGLLGLGFLFGAVGMIGLPPLSGFLGKAGILIATPLHTTGILVWCVMLGGGFLALLACVRAGSTVFWDTTPGVAPAAIGYHQAAVAGGAGIPFLSAMPWLMLLFATTLLTVFGGRAMELAAATAEQLLEPASYLLSVLPAR